MTRRAYLGLLLVAGLAATSCGARIDPPGKPNEDAYVILDKLKDRTIPIEERVGYFAHYNPMIRLRASMSVMMEGDKAIPHIRKALKSKDKRIIRAGCDALCGPFGIAVRKRHLLAAMKPEAAAAAVPDLVPLLDHEDMYVREGALLALSNCGKAAAPHLPKVAEFLDDREWWLRNAAEKVIRGVGSPEADPYTTKLAKTFVKERDVYCMNQMAEALKHLMKTAGTSAAVSRILGEGLAGFPGPYHRYRPLSVLTVMGPKAKAALPALDAVIKSKEKMLERESKTKTPKELHWDYWSLENMKKTREKIVPPAKKDEKENRKGGRK